MVYSLQTRVRRGSRLLPNNRAIVLHQGWQCRWARGMEGRLISAQQSSSNRISCTGQHASLFSKRQSRALQLLCVLITHLWFDRLAWLHRRRGLASDGVRYAGVWSGVGRRFRSVTKLRLDWYGGVFLLLQQRSKHPREMVVTPKASSSLLALVFVRCVPSPPGRQFPSW